MKICYWNNIASPYLVERLNLLHDRGRVEVFGLFNAWNSPDRSWVVSPDELRFPHRIVPSHPQAVARLLRAEGIDVLISLYSTRPHLTTLPLVAPRLPTVLRVLPTYDSWYRRSRAKELAKRAIFRLVHGFKVPGPTGERQVRRYRADARVWHVHQTVPTDLFRPPPQPRPDHPDPLRLGYVGRLVPEKGVADMLEALATPGLRPAVLRVAGDGPMADELPDRVGRCAVERWGYVQRAQLPSFLHELDVLLFPTHGDPFGLVVEESLATGLPVISSTAAGDVQGRVEGRGVGLVHPPSDPPALAAAIRAMEDDERRRAMGDRALAIRGSLGHPAYAEAVEQMVADVLEGRDPVR